MDGAHDSTQDMRQADENVADKLSREAQLLTSGIVGGAVREIEKDPSGVLVKSVVAVGSGLALGAAACAASPWIAGAAAICGGLGTGAWAWSTFNTLDESNRRRNAMLASSVQATWNSKDERLLRTQERVLQDALGRDSLEVGLGVLSGIGAGLGMKYVPQALCKVKPEFGFAFFSQQTIARSFPQEALAFKILRGTESLTDFTQGAGRLARLRVREIHDPGKNGIPRLGKEQELLLTHNGKDTSIEPASLTGVDLLACCDPQLLPPSSRAKSVIQQEGQVWIEADSSAGTLRVLSEKLYHQQPLTRKQPAEAFSLCIERPLNVSQEILTTGLPEPLRMGMISAARTIHAAEAQFGEKAPSRQQVEALRQAYQVVTQRLRQVRAANADGAENLQSLELNRYRTSCFESMFKLYIENPSQFHSSSGHARTQSESNLTERGMAVAFARLLDKGLLKVEVPNRMVLQQDSAMRFKDALRQKLVEIVDERDFAAYVDPRNWMIIHERGTTADHAKADILLCNKATGHYFAIDVTERTDASALFQTSAVLAGKKCYVSTDRHQFVIASSEQNRAFWENFLRGKADLPQLTEQAMLKFLEACIVEKPPFHIMRQVLPYAEKGSAHALEQMHNFKTEITPGWRTWADELDRSIQYLQRFHRPDSRRDSRRISWLPPLEIIDSSGSSEEYVA